jgi:hypothetical protein
MLIFSILLAPSELYRLPNAGTRIYETCGFIETNLKAKTPLAYPA